MYESFLQRSCGPRSKAGLCGLRETSWNGKGSPGAGELPDAQGQRKTPQMATNDVGEMGEYFTHVKGTAGEKVPVKKGTLKHPQKHPGESKGSA